MDRRGFVVLMGGALIYRGIAFAQSLGRVPRIGFLASVNPAGTAQLEAFLEGLRSHDYVDGKSIVIEYRWAEGSFDRQPGLAAELVALKVDLIVAWSSTALALAKQATSTIPIVMVAVGDPVGAGFIASLARPGGNVTGLANRYYELTVKRLELLRDLLPSVKRIAVAGTLASPVNATALTFARTTAARLGVELIARTDVGWDWDHGLDSAIRAGAQAFCVFSNFATHGLRYDAENAVRAVARRRIPAVWVDSETVEIGGLMAYATRLNDELRQAVAVLARVLKGANPGALPVEQASRFELAVNLKTAKSLGLTIPQSILVRADRVIE